jgi:hypothetical protein
MRAGGGKQKGAAFERLVCEKLSLWVTDGKSDCAFWRSAMSGGRATVRHAKGKKTQSQSGDISAVAPEGHALVNYFSIECKFVKDLNLQAALMKGKGPLVEYWKQVSRDAAKAGKRPLLIAKQNNCPVVVFMYYEEMWLGDRWRPQADLYAFSNDESVCMMLFEELLKLDPPQ